MFTIYRRDEISREQLQSQLKGAYSPKCLDKIEAMNGQVVAVLDRGQWQGSVGETLYYICQGGVDNNQELVCTLRTDDSCVSFMNLGYRFEGDDPSDRLVRYLLRTEKEYSKFLIEKAQADAAEEAALATSPG